ncbi:hypothetical protein JAAARDRAFT_182561 [Jaapia argillacea MUCL 33604]|uniref:Fatty acid desaturase domain-containing protein n=1 Tax=Jaapia argillacea MUCL 33604 TaxID=933084 RepID=A0A067PGX9_9AGAM|nr:hypothetical protein JAAARDRAFT_182561 [Jaapia argillacea MUCL 33604]
MFRLFKNSPEYQRRLKTPFYPPKITLSQLHSAVPKHLWQKSTQKALYYVVRDLLFAIAFYVLALYIDPFCCSLTAHQVVSQLLRWSLWCVYWFWQGIVLAGWWCIGHEAGHGTLSPQKWVNHVIGFTLHTSILVPYYSWRSTHHAHHKAVGSIERDENYVPRTRSDYSLPPVSKSHVADYHEIFEETPIYTLGRMLAMQLFGWHAYLCTNALGSKMYPKGTNHFQPSSPLFKPSERRDIIISNVGLAIMSAILWQYASAVGFANFVKLYFIPYLLANHWIVMLTFLHHSDPTIPHYRSKEWSFLRGAAATVDRPLLGWIGRFFLHNVSHDHVAHHFFSTIPFYNQPEVTRAIKKVLKDDYNYDSTNSFYALYRSFTECCFIEDDGEVVFYKNKDGVAQRQLAFEDTAADDSGYGSADSTECESS